jgi:hypothetical protein
MGQSYSSDFSYMTDAGPNSHILQTTANPLPGITVPSGTTGWNYVLWNVNTIVTNPVFTYNGNETLTNVYFALSAPGGAGGVNVEHMRNFGCGGGGAGEIVQTMISQLNPNDTFSLNYTTLGYNSSSPQLTLTLPAGIVMNASPGQDGYGSYTGSNQQYAGTGGNGGSNTNDVGVDSGLIIVTTIAELTSSTAPTAYTVGGQGGQGGQQHYLNDGRENNINLSSGTPGYNSQAYVNFADGSFILSPTGGNGGGSVTNTGGLAGNPASGSMMIYWYTA